MEGRRIARAAALLTAIAAVGCHRHVAPLLPTRYASTALGTNPLSGDLVPVHDPALAHAGGQWYAWTTDNTFAHEPGFLQVRCSPDARNWHRCGHVFDELPAWVRHEVPEAEGLWAPEVAFFGGLWHLYYVVSRLGSPRAAIGLATSPTLDVASPQYHWTDRGEVLSSGPGDKFNALDPSITADASGLWLTYGSFRSGIRQQRLDPTTGMLSSGDKTVYRLAEQPRSRNGAIEGASLLARNGWYYLFASVGVCCDIPIERDTYRQIVGRSRSVHGPFVDEHGGKMLDGGGTVLLDSDAEWLAPGGGAAYTDPATGRAYLAFHALKRHENGALYLWIKAIDWQDDWPVLRNP